MIEFRGSRLFCIFLGGEDERVWKLKHTLSST
nr:MAG TPA: hypothetical protein [Caudoviricetes sp.]